MTEFPDVSEFLAPDLVLPYRGKKYRVPAPPAKAGMRIQAYWSLGVAVHAGATPREDQAKALLGDDEEAGFYQDTLGPAYEEMVEDGVPLPVLRHAAITALFDVVHGRQAAQDYWTSPAGKATTARATSSSTGGASTTKKRASGSGTKSRQKKSTG
ncbi:hypothetical protein CLV30_12819 [Haloactinopolyspora alba]|uniref:DUF7426 domain-containing protein n=1 Tax=Haloactinopolyspora alba TaxID=648780 RepID=A0A2P8DF00_9ACTN|nr:hypothetical protein [Haloactinopolyspora alba]PSK95767.1 hypothetical protein CLV30_12819 [Haloactinopolyspora alba]